jgi:hypothetical protein
MKIRVSADSIKIFFLGKLTPGSEFYLERLVVTMHNDIQHVGLLWDIQHEGQST